MDATIIEVAYHDNVSDAQIMRDPKGRNAIARAAYHAVIKYMNKYDTTDAVPLTYLPEPVRYPRATGSTNGITVAWTAPLNQSGSSSPTNYLVYYSTNGYGFGNAVSVGNVLTYTFTNLAANTDYYFQVAAANAAGQAFPSEVVGCRRAATNGAVKVLYVNAFDRFERTIAPYQSIVAGTYDPPGASGTIQRVIPRMINSFDYITQHGKALQAYGMAFDSCQNDHITNNAVGLTNYPMVIWACGQESTGDESFNSVEQAKVTAYLAAGGHLFVSGSEIGWDLDRASGPTAADRAFMNNQLHADFGTDANDDSGIYTVTAVADGIFAGNANAAYDDGTKGIYYVQTPDIILPQGTGAKAALYYNGTNLPAAVQYDGSAGGGRVVYLSIPFETIATAANRTTVLTDILNFFQPAKVLAGPQAATVVAGSNATFNVTGGGAVALSYQWYFNNVKITGATASALTVTNSQATNAGSYFVIITNAAGAATSAPVALTVQVPPVVTVPPASQLVAQGSNVFFTVVATGTPTLFYQWQFNGSNVVGASTTALSRTNLQPADAGGYAVVVSNVAGKATSAVAQLTVDVPTRIDAGSGLDGQGFRLQFTGTAAFTNVVETSTNLTDWSEVTNLVNSSGTSLWVDPETNLGQKFYRVRRQ